MESAVNLLDASLFTERREHDVFRVLRDSTPVFFHPEPGGPGFYAVSRYADVSSVLKSPEIFCNGKGTQIQNRRAEGHGAASIHNLDAPRHAKLRGAALPGMRREILVRLEPQVRGLVRDLIDACPRNEPFDFVANVAVTLPMMVIGEMLGVPIEDRPLTVDWANTMTSTSAREASQAKARGELFHYFRRLVETKRVAPGNDLASVLAQATVDGEPLSQEDLDAYFMVLTAAGNETTRFLISGGLEQLCLQPDDLASLARTPEAIPAAVEEMTRWVSPVMMMRRTATQEAELAGTAIQPGDKVVIYFVSANRDERIFADPQRFLPMREDNPHLGFGQGPHFCLGTHLARLEARIFFEELFQRVSNIRLERPGEKLASYWFSGYANLPIRWN